MEFFNVKTFLAVAVTSLLSINVSAQDLLARQAPIDKKLKAVDSLLLTKQLKAEQAEFPAFDVYPEWSNEYVHRIPNVKLPESYTIDLSDFCMPTPHTRITSKFGPRKRRMHYGLDVKVYVGDSICSAFDGRVRVVRTQRGGYGKYILIRHDNGLETVYAHLSKQLVEENQFVRAGEVIGLGGNTGRSTGSHLHFETRFLGVPIDPILLFDFEKQDIVADTYTFKAGSKSRSASGSTYTAAGSDGVIRYYKVKSGDTLSRIASRNGVTVSALCKLNRITTKTILRPGQVLRCS